MDFENMAEIHVLSIPDEIIVDIVKRLEGRDIKALRATCKKLNRIASTYLFPVLYLSCHQLDLDVFRLVTSNHLLIGGVRELVIDDTTLPPSISDWATYQKVAISPEHRCDRKTRGLLVGETDIMDEGRIDKLLSQVKAGKQIRELYYRVFQGHHENRLVQADIKALKEAIPHFKALRSLVVTNRTTNERHVSGSQSYHSSSPVNKMWKRTAFALTLSVPKQKVPFAPRCEWAEASNFKDEDERLLKNKMDWLDDRFCNNIMASGMPGTEGKFYEDQSIAHRHMRGELLTISRKSRVIFIALHVLEDPKLCSQLTEFRVDESEDILNGSFDPGLAITLFDKYSPFPERLTQGFLETRNLTKFRLVLSNKSSGRKGETIMKEGRVGKLFAAMPQLEDLYFEPHGMSTVAAIPSNLTFHRLRQVSFSCGDVDSKELIEFLRRHGPTLKRLKITYCNIDPARHGEDWNDVVRQMTAMMKQGIIKIDNVDFRCVIESDVVLACGRSATLDFTRETITDDEIYFWSCQNGAWTERTSLAVGSDDESDDGSDNVNDDLFHSWQYCL